MLYCIAGFGGVQAAALTSSFRPHGQERAPKSAQKDAPTVVHHVKKLTSTNIVYKIALHGEYKKHERTCSKFT